MSIWKKIIFGKLKMLAVFVNNNPYNLEFFIAVSYDVPQKNHVEEMIELFENSNLILRNDLTFLLLLQESGNRRFNSNTFASEQEVDLILETMFFFRN